MQVLNLQGNSGPERISSGLHSFNNISTISRSKEINGLGEVMKGKTNIMTIDRNTCISTENR